MKRDNYGGCFVVIFAIIAIFLIALVIWRTNAIVNSDLPDWWKFILLK